MANFVFAAPAPIVLPVAGSAQLFPVRRIYCVGRNYADHIREMGGDPAREKPFFFMKPADAIVLDGGTVPYPSMTSDFHYEIELVIAIGKAGGNIPVAQADAHAYGVAVGIDLTRRDLQFAARNVGRPWETGKSFDHSAPCSALLPLNGKSLPGAGKIALSVNGVAKQDGDLAQMVWSSAEIIAQLSLLFELQPGDLIYTGTPAGVGPVVAGDQLDGQIDGIGQVRVTIV
jgi:fumarylpyruvate hydrolase